MSNRNEVANLYQMVIEEVVRNIRREFVNMGVDEQVLHELQTGWERRLLRSGIFHMPPPPQNRINIVPGSAAAAMYYYSHPGTVPLAAASDANNFKDANFPFQNNNNIKQINADGLEALSSVVPDISEFQDKKSNVKRHEDSDPDALNSDLDSSSSEDEKNLIGGPTSPKSSADVNLLEEEENNSSALKKENILLVLYEKVHRTRNKWRCTFREGILHVDGQEYCLNKISGEFEW